MGYRIGGVVSIIVSLYLMNRVTRLPRKSGPDGEVSSWADVLLTGIVMGLNGGFGVYKAVPEHYMNPPIPFADKLVYWAAGVFMSLALLRILTAIRPIGRWLSALGLGFVVMLAVWMSLLGVLGPR